MQDDQHWRLDKTINLPSLLTIAGVAISVTFWVAGIQAQVNQIAKDQGEFRVTWAQFNISRDQAVRSYENRMTTVEQSNKEVLRRLDSIAEDVRRLQPVRQ